MKKYVVEKMKGGIISFPSMKDIASSHREWVFGDFVKGVSNSMFEVKISNHKKDASRDEWSPVRSGEMLCIVESGSLLFQFKSPEESSLIVNAGQMVRCPNTTPHKWKVLEDNTKILTIRSFCDDCKKKGNL